MLLKPNPSSVRSSNQIECCPKLHVVQSLRHIIQDTSCPLTHIAQGVPSLSMLLSLFHLHIAQASLWFIFDKYIIYKYLYYKIYKIEYTGSCDSTSDSLIRLVTYWPSALTKLMASPKFITQSIQMYIELSFCFVSWLARPWDFFRNGLFS